MACIVFAFIGSINTQRTAIIYVNNKTADEMPIIGDTGQLVFVVDSNYRRWRVDNVWLWKTIHEEAFYNVTFYPGSFPDMDIYPTIINATPTQPTPYTQLGTNPTHQPPGPHPPPEQVEYIYGLNDNPSTLSYEWEWEHKAPLLQPRWLPEGMKKSAVYVLRANASAHSGGITQVTSLYSFGGDADPNTAELQLRVQMSWNDPWMNPKNLYDSLGRGNYTGADGNSAYMGVIGWFDGDYYQMYGGNALIMSIKVGDVRYFMRAPEGFPDADLMKIARSMGFYNLAK